MRKFLLLTICSVVTLMSYAGVADIRSSTLRHPRKTSARSIDPSKIRPELASGHRLSGSTQRTLPSFGASAPVDRPTVNKFFYGYMVYSSVDYDLGIYKISPGNGYKMFIVDPYEQLGFDMMPFNGWYVDGVLNGLSLFYFDPTTPMGYFYYSMDLSTGKLLEYNEYQDWYNFDYLFEICNLNTDDGRIYGYAANLNDADWKYYWAWASQENPTDVHIIRQAEEYEHFISMCYRADQQLFYGITYDFYLASIDIDGNITYIRPLPHFDDAFFYPLQSGLIWDYESEKFYWNAQIVDNSFLEVFGFLYSITEDGRIEKVEQYSYDQQFSFFYSTEEYINPNAPLKPEISEIIFEGASLSGKMNVVLPETFGDELSLPSSISYTALLDGEEYSNGTAKPGESVTIDYKVDKPGEYSFGIYVTANGYKSKIAYKGLYVGSDTPLSPQNVLLTPTSLSWEAVTEGIHGGYVDTANLSYIISMNGSELATVKDLTYSLDLLKNAGLTRYTASVAAVSDGMTGEVSYSNTIVAGQPVALPLNYTPTQEQFETMTVFNVEGDTYMYEGTEITWELTRYGLFSGGTEWNYSSMDDYIFLPPVTLQKGKTYSLKFDSGIYSDWYPKEFLNVVCATNPTPVGVVSTILKDYTPKVYLKDNNWTEWDKVALEFSVETDGVYYVGFQCVSKTQQYGIYIRDIEFSGDDAGVESVSLDKVSVSSPAAGVISIKGGEGKNFIITTFDGRIIYSGVLMNNSASYEVGSGLFIVKVGKVTAKVIVK